MYLKIKHFFFLLLIFVSQKIIAQQDSIKPTTEKYTTHNKGKIYIYWGGNRVAFTNSSLGISGNGYNFILHDLKSHDRPQGWTSDFINPTRMTIPQYNFRVGYYISDHYNVSFGIDHMKYIMTQDQLARISGNYPTSYNGNQINNGNVNLKDGTFLAYENTDGLNYPNFEIARVDDLSKYLGVKNTDKFQVNFTEGLGLGPLYPRTDAQLFLKKRRDEFSLAGYGMHAKIGLNLTFFKHYFVQGELRGGYINLSSIRLSDDKADVGKQDFFFLQNAIVFGTIWKLF